ncbi:MAG TPA: TonB family protein [Longimicrobium sp.]
MSGFEGTLTGRVLAGRYLVQDPIGRGGMGAVYRARDQRLGRAVALKVIMVPDADAATHDRLRHRFVREAQAAARLRHPHVVTVHDFGTDDALGVDYLVMELLEGEDLASRIRQGGRLPAGAALAVVSQAARGLAAGHRAGMVHRDVKPGNLFLELDEHGEVQVQVLDFGIAQVAFDEPSLALAGRDPLSPTYAAPEQLRGGDRITPAAVVFSLAAVAVFLLTGQRPFTGEAATQAAEAEAALGQLEDTPEVTPAVHDVLRRALDMDPGRRWPDAHAFREALETARGTGTDTLRASVIAVSPSGAVPAFPDDATLLAGADDDRTLYADAPPSAPRPAPAAPPVPAAGRRPAVGPPARRSPLVPVLAGVVALAAAGAALAYVRPWEPREPQAPPVAAGPDSATLDSLARVAEADSLARMERQQDLIQAALDSVRRVDSLAREQERLAQADTQAGLPGAEPLPPTPVETPAVDGVYELSAVERRPDVRNLRDVERWLQRNYPRALRDSRVAGRVQVGFVIGANGRAEMGTVQVLSSTHPAFESAAVRAVERMRFSPAEAGGRRVRVRVELPIQFQITN